MDSKLPSRGFTFWPVGNGDSTTIVIDVDTVLQIDINHLEKSEDNDEPTWAVIEHLVEHLPRRNGRPYLAAFALTHPDQDHCRGFHKLVDEVDIGELWLTPRIFLEYKNDLCDDAAAFRDEAKRRVKATIVARGDPGDGNRVRLFGASDLLEEDDYKNFPEDRLVIPGSNLTTINDINLENVFCAFVHAPFKDDIEGERNDTSLALQITLRDGDAALRALLLGDLPYPVLKKIFERSDDNDLAWNLLLSPHHCSKSAMFWKGPEGEEEMLKQDILDAMATAAERPTYVIASSHPVPQSDKEGADPPHAKAKKCYEEVTETFLCTMEHPSEEDPEPIIFELSVGGIEFLGVIPTVKSAAEAAREARGGDEPPSEPTTYGRRR